MAPLGLTFPFWREREHDKTRCKTDERRNKAQGDAEKKETPVGTGSGGLLQYILKSMERLTLMLKSG